MMSLFKRLCRPICHGGAIPCGLQGFATAVIWLHVVTAARLALGTGPGTTLALTLAVFAGVLSGRWLAERFPVNEWARRVAALAATVAAILSPWWLMRIGTALQAVPVETLSRPGMETVWRLMMVLPPVGLCTAAIDVLFKRPNENRSSRFVGIPVASLVGFALSLLVSPTLLLPWFESRMLLLSALAVVLAAILWDERRGIAARPDADASPSLEPSPGLSAEFVLGTAFLSGAGLAIAASMMALIVPRTFATEFALPGGLLLGFALSPSARSYRRQGTPATATTLALSPGVWIAGLILLFPCFVRLSLRTSAFLSNVILISAARHALLMCGAVPAGWILGSLLSWIPSCRNRLALSSLGVAALGFFGVQMLPIGPGLASVVVIIGSLAMGAWACRGFLASGDWSGRRLAWPAAMTLVAVLGLCLPGRYRPDLAEKLLYSGGIFASLRSGTPASQLHVLDGGRLVACAESLRGRSSAWSYRGTQLLVRQDGISSEYRSTNPHLAPHSAADVLPAAFLMNLHPAAEHVLVLGWHTPTLETCLSFPVHSVSVIEADSEVLRLDALLRSQGRSPALTDETRFKVWTVDPLLAVQSRHARKYDVILDPQPQPVTAAGGSRRTAEHYAAIRRQLSENGLYCQRLAYYDLGPREVARIAATFYDQFPHCLLTESVPGELLMIGSPSADPVVAADMVSRLKAPQSRAVLAGAGLDWSALLGRGGLNSDSVRELVSGVSSRCDLASVNFGFALAREMMAWGDKASDSRGRLGQHGKSLAVMLGSAPEIQEIDQRLEDLRTAQQIQDSNPDQPWAYRAVIKQRLSERPRSAVIQVKGEGLKHGLHPEDQRRKDYLIDLAHVAKQEHPPINEIWGLQVYAEPFDPLLSLFVHYEMARLMGSQESPPPRPRFEELVHTVYHSTPADRSVRNVCTAIELLCREPATVSGPEQRWDHLNGLLDMLAVRWQARLADGRQRKFDQVDAEHSIRSAELALQTMQTLRPDVAVSAADWELREAVLTEHLLKPVRQYRSRLLKQVVLAPGSGDRP